MRKAELEENFGKELADGIEMSTVDESGSTEESNSGAGKESKGVKLGHIYEIWDKATKSVIFISPGSRDTILKEVPDPLKLVGFFPTPKPMQFFRRVNSIQPATLYSFYEEQAKELNDVSLRIRKIVRAMKVRGFYDGTIEGIDKVLDADDNVLIPAGNVASLQQGYTLEKAIFLMPIEKLVTVLNQLYGQRQQIKQVIYEITGIADIMRGSSAASETLGAQQLKTQWGTLRLRRMQKEVSRYARDCLRMMAEISVSFLAPDRIKAMTGSTLPLASEKAQAQELAGKLQATQQQVTEEISAALSKPSIEDLLAALKDDLQRAYKIDIETNSTVEAEASEDKKDISELMNAVAQFLNGAAPAVSSGLLPFGAAKAILLGVVRRYRFGEDVEEFIKEMQQPAPPKEDAPKAPAGDSREVVAAKSQSALAQEQMKQATIRLEMNALYAEHKFKLEELDRKAELALAVQASKLRNASAPRPAPAPQRGVR